MKEVMHFQWCKSTHKRKRTGQSICTVRSKYCFVFIMFQKNDVGVGMLLRNNKHIRISRFAEK